MRFIRIDMSTRQVNEQNVPEAFLGLGGRGLTAAIINTEVPPLCDPLGPENKLIFAPGLLSGTRLANTSRISIGAKSPLTNTIKESNAGGTAGEAFGRLGITALIIEGCAPAGELWTIRIDADGKIEFIDAGAHKNVYTYALAETLFDQFGSDNAVLCIGPAGEQQFKSASVQCTDVDQRPCRAAGRGGLGAVMGAKGIKALVVARTKNEVPIADPETFKEAAKQFAKAVRANPFSGQLLPGVGTAGLVAIVNSMGAFPSYNATKGVFEGWEKISGETMTKIITERGGNPTHMGCSGCVIHCSNVYVDKDGTYITSSLEYETIWSMGGMTGIDDLDTIARLDRLCDDIGVDTMNVGVAVAVAMDAGYKPFGDDAAAIAMVEEIGKGTEMGKLLGNGPDAVGKHFNHHRVATVKGQSIAAYDPRGHQGTGVTYATSPMGADHTAGNVIGEYLSGNLDPLKPDGQAEASRNTQIAMASVDCTGLCILASFCLVDPEAGGAFLTAMNAKFGTNFGPEAIPAQGINVLETEREFNRRAGLGAKDDRLPEFFKKEPLAPHNSVFSVSDADLDGTLKFGGEK
jgi:aldehyde:ferredoxin oxidoreductase